MQESMIAGKVSRRQALRRLAAAAGICVAMRGSGAFGAESSSGQAPGAAAPGAAAPHLNVKDAAAVAVGYVEDAAQVDAKKYPTFSKGSNCANCLQLQGAEGASYRPCTLFPGKLVAAAGWCSAWTAEI
jgi:hypothetical protein